MSYDISLCDENGKVLQCETPHQLTGGTIRVDDNLNQIPISEAKINITYNYTVQYKRVWSGGSMNVFEGKKARRIIPVLTEGVRILGTDTDDDYWSSTPGNAGKALSDLLFLCEQCPEGVVNIC